MIDTELVGSALTVRLSGDIDHFTAASIRADIDREVRMNAVDLLTLDFSDVSFILLDQKYNLRHRTDLFFEQAGFLPRIQLEAAQITTACALAQAGLGASFLPDRLLTEAVRGLVYYKVGHPQARREMYAATNAKSYKSLSTIRFIDKLVAFYARDATAPSQA